MHLSIRDITGIHIITPMHTIHMTYISTISMDPTGTTTIIFQASPGRGNSTLHPHHGKGNLNDQVFFRTVVRRETIRGKRPKDEGEKETGISIVTCLDLPPNLYACSLLVTSIYYI